MTGLYIIGGIAILLLIALVAIACADGDLIDTDTGDE